MYPLPHLLENQNRSLVALAVPLLLPALAIAFLSGCHNRAYNELYIESMAAEIRDLEDQLYEYDYEYQQLEQKLAATAAENARLQSMLANPAAPQSQRKLPMGLDFLPRTAPKPLSDELPQPPGNSGQMPGTADDLVPGANAGGAESILEVPSLDSESSLPTLPDIRMPAAEPERLPDPPSRNTPAQNGPMGSGTGSPPGLRPRSNNGLGIPPSAEEIVPDFQLEDLELPKIEPGEPIPPPSSGGNPGFTDARAYDARAYDARAYDTRAYDTRAYDTGAYEVQANQPRPNEARAPALDELNLNSGRIELPVQLAGQTSLSPATGPARLTVATEQVTDRRIVELAFNPVHSHAMNVDDDAADDGLILLLQPKNERGQIVVTPAALSIVVVDPAREGNASRIGRWDYTAAEVSAKFESLGTAQGIHLTLPWNGPDPKADRVIVFARYTFENGRQVVGQKEIFVAGADGYKAVWTPRGSANADAAVRHASAEQ